MLKKLLQKVNVSEVLPGVIDAAKEAAKKEFETHKEILKPEIEPGAREVASAILKKVVGSI